MSAWLARLGEGVLRRLRRHVRVAATVAAVVVHALRPSTWRRPVRAVLARQVLFTGVEALPFAAMVAVVIGLAVVLQTQVQLSRFGQTALIGPILAAVVVREAGPLLVNFVVIMRSGTAIASELSTMKLTGQLRVLDSQGVDPFPYLAVPRAIGVATAVSALAIVFVGISLASGYLVGLLIGAPMEPWDRFVDGIAAAVLPSDVANVLAKTWIPGLLTGVICTLEGLDVQTAWTEIPQAATRGVVRSVAALFLVVVIVSLVTYL
ncbi:MAG: ABC transporter permease [Kiritimatiellae bacterium]|nr:ABC transporter permease [Kiritimatiellia bacterium]